MILIGVCLELLHVLNLDKCKILRANLIRYFLKLDSGKLELLKTMTLSSPVRSIAWNHLKPTVMAAGLFNGDVVVIDVEKYHVK